MKYRFNFVKKGYDPVEVDAYISGLEEALKNYKDKDNAIANAILNAQVAADRIIKEAQSEASIKVKNMKQTHDRMKALVDMEKQKLDNYCFEYENLISKFITGNEARSVTQELYSKLDSLKDSLNFNEETSVDNTENMDNTQKADAEETDQDNPSYSEMTLNPGDLFPENKIANNNEENQFKN